MIILIIGLVAIVDHLGSQRISQAVVPRAASALVAATRRERRPSTSTGPGPGSTRGRRRVRTSGTPTLLSAVLPSAYVIGPKFVP